MSELPAYNPRDVFWQSFEDCMRSAGLTWFKVQISLGAGDRVLIYNEKRTVQWEGHLQKDMRRWLKNRPISYCQGKVEKGIVVLVGEGPVEVDLGW